MKKTIALWMGCLINIFIYLPLNAQNGWIPFGIPQTILPPSESPVGNGSEYLRTQYRLRQSDLITQGFLRGNWNDIEIYYQGNGVLPIQVYLQSVPVGQDTQLCVMSNQFLVFQGYLTSDSSGWSRFPLQFPFFWNGREDIRLQFCISPDTAQGNVQLRGQTCLDSLGYRLSHTAPLSCEASLSATLNTFRPALRIHTTFQLPSADSILYSPQHGLNGAPPEGMFLRWQDVLAAGRVTQYEVLLDTLNPPLQRIALVPSLQDSFHTGNLIPQKNYFWKVIPRNPAGADSSGTINHFTTQASYCVAPVLFSGGSKLASCTLNNQFFYSGDSCTQNYFHSDNLQLTTGDSLRVIVQRTSCSAYRNWYLRVGLDRNGDGDFQDTGELLLQSSVQSGNIYTSSTIIPSCSVSGFTRLRLMISESPFSGNWCQPIAYGESEDFWVRGILPGVPTASLISSSLNGHTDICPETPLFTISPGQGSIHSYLIRRDTQALFLNADSFFYSSSQLNVRFPDTMSLSQLYYYQVIPVGPGGFATNAPTESFSTSTNFCTDTLCLQQSIFPTNGQTGIYPSGIEIDWHSIGGIPVDSMRIVWDTINPPTRLQSTYFSGNQTNYFLAFPPENQRVYWKAELKNRNGTIRQCSTLFSFHTTTYPCKPQYSVGNRQGDYLSYVRLGSQFRTSGPEVELNAYHQVKSPVFIVQAGTSANLIVSAGSYPSGNHISAWIDFNRNGLWEVSEKLGEVHIQGPSPLRDTIAFIVPACTDTGYTLLRVRETWGIENMDPCAEYPYGETEEFLLHILPSNPLPPACPMAVFPTTGLDTLSYWGDTLRWSYPFMGSCPTNTRLYLGTNNPPSNRHNGLSIGLSINLFTDTLQANTQYYWKIVSENGFGNSQNCPIQTFRTCAIPVPPNLLPPSGIGCDRATFLFQPRIGISAYQIQVGRDSLFQQMHPLFACSTVYNTDRLAVSSLSGQSLWFARIRSLTTCDTGAWSNAQVIQLANPPSAVQIQNLQPGNCQEILISWHNSPGSQHYQLDASMDSTFQSYLSGYNQVNIYNSRQLWIGGLRASRNYYTRIRGVNTCGAGPWSNVTQVSTSQDSWAGIDSSWHHPWNWCSGNVPDSLTDIRIEGSLPIQPSILSKAWCRNLQIEPGARLRQHHSDTLHVYGNWNNAGNFQSGNGTVYFKSLTTTTFRGTDTLNNILVYNPSDMTIDSSSLLMVKGFLTPVWGYLNTNGRLEFLMDSLKQSGVLRALSPMSGVRGSVRMRQILSRTGGNRLLCSPFTNISIGNWWSTLGGNQDTYRYIEHALGPQQQGFQIMYDPTDTLDIGRGYYVVSLPNTQMNLQGNLKEGTMNFPVTWTVDPLNRSASGWNLIGNPYLCPIHWNAPTGWQKSAISNAVFYLDPASGQQVGYINGIGTMGAGPVISPGQGFWVKATGAHTQLILDERAKTAQSGKFFRETQTFHGYRIQLEEKSRPIAESLIRFVPGTNSSFDSDWDLEYPGPLIAHYLPQIWLKYKDSLNFVIQSLSYEPNLPDCEVCLDLPQAGKWSVSVQLDKTDVPLSLESFPGMPEGVIVEGNQITSNRAIRICPWKLTSEKIRLTPEIDNQAVGLKTYPNPLIIGGTLNWQVNPKQHSEEELTLKITDNLGRVWLNQKTTGYSGKINWDFNTNAGMFHFQVIGNQFNYSTSVIIFQDN
jgi:hypothetical protein